MKRATLPALGKQFLLLGIAPLLLAIEFGFPSNTATTQSEVGSTAIKLECPIASAATGSEPVRGETEVSEDLFELYKIVDRIVRANDLRPQNWMVEIVRDSSNYAITPAWCQIAIEEKLFDLLKRDRDRIAFVVAHEIAHNTLEHRYIFSQFVRQIQQELAVVRQTEKPRKISRLEREANARVRALRHSQEFEADAKAYEYMARAGYDARDSLQGLKALEYLAPADSSSATHPSLEARLHRLQEHMRLVPPEQLLREGHRQLEGSSPLTYQLLEGKNSLVITRSDRTWH